MRNFVQCALVAIVCVVAIPPIVGAAVSNSSSSRDVNTLRSQVIALNARVTSTQDRIRALTNQLKAKAGTAALSKVQISATAATATATAAAGAANGALAAANAAKASSDAGLASLTGVVAAIPRGPKAWAEVDNGVVSLSSGNVSVTHPFPGQYCVTANGLSPHANPATVSMLFTATAPTGYVAYAGTSGCAGASTYTVSLYYNIDTPTPADGSFFIVIP